MPNKKNRSLRLAQLNALPISVGEARKLLNADEDSMSDENVARKILLLSELARMLTKTLDLQK